MSAATVELDNLEDRLIIDHYHLDALRMQRSLTDGLSSNPSRCTDGEMQK